MCSLVTISLLFILWLCMIFIYDSYNTEYRYNASNEEQNEYP